MFLRKIKWDSLEDVLHGSWAMLERGAGYFNDPFHWPVLGTTGMDGANLRTVILRQFILPDRLLICHTDARSPKVQQISKSPKTSWLFYHPKKMIQLRILGNATLHMNDQFANEQWERVKLPSRLNYSADKPPGTPIDEPSSGLTSLLTNKVGELFESEGSRANFMSISCRIDHMDCLMLNLLGNRRARFDWDHDNLSSSWLIP